MLPNDLQIPALSPPYDAALMSCLEHVFSTYEVIGIVATGTIVRGGGDSRSDLDIHVLHSGTFRERVQLFFNGVPAEIFVNPPARIAGYFAEDVEDRKPIAPHMFATGHVVFDPTGVTANLVEDAKQILANPPGAPSQETLTIAYYSAATEFEDVDDLSNRDPAAAAVLLGGVVRKLAEVRLQSEQGWLPRGKDLLLRLREVDPISGTLAEAAASNQPFPDRLEAARELCIRVTGADGFFEWTSRREELA